MTRQPLNDGGWFDLDQSQSWDESTWWNGNNHISHATGSQWEHEKLYWSRKGNWVLNHWSQYQGVPETWEQVTPAQAAEWLIRNEHAEEDWQDLPEDVRQVIEEHVAESEV